MSKLQKTNDRLDNLLKSIDELAKMSPMAAGALRGAAVGAVTGGIKGAVGARGKVAKDDPPHSTASTGISPSTVNVDAARSIMAGAFGSSSAHKAEKAESLEKPPVSEAQRRAMHAAANGKSTLDIPASVGKDFADADKGGKLPEKKKKDKAEKADDNTNGTQHFEESKFVPGNADLQHGKPDADNWDNAPNADKPKKEKEETLNADNAQKLEKRPDTANKADGAPPAPKPPTPAVKPEAPKAEAAKPEPRTLDYSAMKPPKAKESEAPTISYGSQGSVKRTPGATDAGFKTPKEKLTPLKNPAFRTKLAEARRRAGVAKHYDAIMAGEDVLSKAEKDELFSEGPWKMQTVEYHPDKEAAANSVYYSIMRLAEIRSQSYSVQDKNPEAKKAFEYLYDCEKTKLKEHVECFKTAKPRKETKLSKTEALLTIDSATLTKSLRKNHSDGDIGLMIKAAFDAGKIHRNVLLEWQNYGTVNPAILSVYESED